MGFIEIRIRNIVVTGGNVKKYKGIKRNKEKYKQIKGALDIKDFLRFGKVKLNHLVCLLFWSGNIPIALCSYIGVRHFFAANTAGGVTQQSENGYTFSHYSMPLNNPALGIFSGILFFVSGILLWRMVCEILFIIVRYLKNNTKPDNEE